MPPRRHAAIYRLRASTDGGTICGMTKKTEEPQSIVPMACPKCGSADLLGVFTAVMGRKVAGTLGKKLVVRPELGVMLHADVPDRRGASLYCMACKAMWVDDELAPDSLVMDVQAKPSQPGPKGRIVLAGGSPDALAALRKRH